MSLDLASMAGCPTSLIPCQVCGDDAKAIFQSTMVSSRIGVLCIRRCQPCAEQERGLEQLDAMLIADLVFSHCRHLGITYAQMRAALPHFLETQEKP